MKQVLAIHRNNGLQPHFPSFTPNFSIVDVYEVLHLLCSASEVAATNETFRFRYVRKIVARRWRSRQLFLYYQRAFRHSQWSSQRLTPSNEAFFTKGVQR